LKQLYKRFLLLLASPPVRSNFWSSSGTKLDTPY